MARAEAARVRLIEPTWPRCSTRQGCQPHLVLGTWVKCLARAQRHSFAFEKVKSGTCYKVHLYIRCMTRGSTLTMHTL